MGFSFGIFLITFVGEFGLPLPFLMQGLLVSLGYAMSVFGLSSVWAVILAAILGSMAGVLAVYALSSRVGESFLFWKRYAKYREKAQTLLEKTTGHPHLAILGIAVARLTPGLLTIISIVAGATKFSFWNFLIGSFLSIVVWNSIFVGVGFVFGKISI